MSKSYKFEPNSDIKMPKSSNKAKVKQNNKSWKNQKNKLKHTEFINQDELDEYYNL